MKKLAVVTATRAEYGLLAPVIRSLRTYETDALKIELIVTGTHLSEQYGQTVSDIDVRIDHKIPVSVRSDTELSISSNQAEVLVKFTELFLTERYQAVLLLGDRYETLAVAIAAGNTRTPVFHLCGGDTTEGALDEWIRHSITKISYLHFVTNEESRKRVIQLGEDPARVFNYGSTSIDNILSVSNLTKASGFRTAAMRSAPTIRSPWEAAAWTARSRRFWRRFRLSRNWNSSSRSPTPIWAGPGLMQCWMMRRPGWPICMCLPRWGSDAIFL